MLFTSGSTGRPKPVAVPHRALAAVVPRLRELFGLTPEDRVLQYASLSWDTAFEELLPTLTAGAGVVFGCDAHRGSLSRLLGLVERAGVTVLNLPTAVWHELVLHLAESGLRPARFRPACPSPSVWWSSAARRSTRRGWSPGGPCPASTGSGCSTPTAPRRPR